MSSRLFEELREKESLVYSISAESESYQDTGILYINTAIEKDSLFKNKNKNTDNGALFIILNTLEKILKNGVTQQELNKAKNNFENKISMTYENTNEMALFYNEQYLFEYTIKFTIQEILDNIKKVTLKKINNIIKETLSLEKMSICIIGNYTKEQVYNYLIKTFIKK